MNIDQLKKRFPDDDDVCCQRFFEFILWKEGRICPHCYCEKSYHMKRASVRTGVYECSRCKRHFMMTTKTPIHSTKLGLKKPDFPL
jgi:hypothetical protein